MKYIVTLNNTNYEVEVEESEVSLVSTAPAAPVVPAAPVAAPVQASAPAQTSAVAGEKVVSPMPGTILEVKASVGTAVKKGDVIIVLEAMKMENDVVASADGTIKQILVQKGSAVETDDVLAVIG